MKSLRLFLAVSFLALAFAATGQAEEKAPKLGVACCPADKAAKACCAETCSCDHDKKSDKEPVAPPVAPRNPKSGK